MKHILTYIALFISCLVYGQIGTLDLTFGNQGKIITNPAIDSIEGIGSIAIQNDGKIVASYNYVNPENEWREFAITRYNTNGSVDTSFGLNGTRRIRFNFIAIPYPLAIQTDGKIVLAGFVNNPGNRNFCITRLTSSGDLDTTFGPNNSGIIENNIIGGNEIYSIALQGDGKIVVAGITYDTPVKDYIVARYNVDGDLDTTFGTGGIVYTQVSDYFVPYGIYSLAIQSDGKILATGLSYNGTDSDICIVRYNTDGSLDNSFGNSGKVIHDLLQINEQSLKIVLQPDGRIVIGGLVSSEADVNDIDFLIARYNTDGTIDNTFNTTGYNVIDVGLFSDVNYLLMQPDGKFLIGGTLNLAHRDLLIYRIKSNGSIDSSFNQNGYLTIDFDDRDESGTGAAIQPDGKIVLCGSSTEFFDFRGVLVRILSGLTIGNLEFSQTETAPLLYPNPLQNTEHLKYTLASDDQISIVLLDGQGKLVATFAENEKQVKGDHEVELNLPNGLPSGNYFIQIASPKGKISIKAIK